MRLSRRIADWLVHWRWPLLFAGILAAALCFLPSQQVEFDRSIENMFAEDDPLLPPYRRLKERFGGNEIVMAVYTDEQLFAEDGSGIARLDEIGKQLKEVPGVRDVLSLADVNKALKLIELFDIYASRNFLRLARRDADPIVKEDDSVRRGFLQVFEGYTHGGDGKTAAVVCMLQPENESDVPRRQTVIAIRRIISREEGGLIAGEPVMVVDGFRYVEEDGARLGWWTTILLAVTIALCFRSLRWLIIPVAVVQLALLLTWAVLVYSGLRLSMVSTMLTAIVTVVGVATVVHVIVRFREGRRMGHSSRGSLLRTIALVATPVFWACATDAAGFLSLLMADVGPVQDFGVMMAIGSLAVIPAAAMAVPALALFGSRLDAGPKTAWGEKGVDAVLGGLMRFVDRRPLAAAVLTFIPTIVASCGVFFWQVESDFTRNFREGTPVVRSYAFVEENLGGAGVWDVVLPAPPALDDEYMRRVRELEEELRAIESVDPAGGKKSPALKVVSLADADYLVSLEGADEAAKKRYGSLAEMTPEERIGEMSKVMPTFVSAMLTPEPDGEGRRYFRIMLRARERQPAEQKQALIGEVERIVSRRFPAESDPPGGDVTGFFVLLADLIKSLVDDQWRTFGVAVVAIGLLMLVAFRSFRLTLAALVPNAMPILVVLGMMGWLGVRINMGAAMIAATSMGLSIDSSIHYIISFRRERRAGRTVSAALAEVQKTVGRAMVFSTLALIVGFSVLCTSSFIPTVYFGALVSLAMLGGLAGNLVLLPLLLKLLAGQSR